MFSNVFEQNVNVTKNPIRKQERATMPIILQHGLQNLFMLHFME